MGFLFLNNPIYRGGVSLFWGEMQIGTIPSRKNKARGPTFAFRSNVHIYPHVGRDSWTRFGPVVISVFFDLAQAWVQS